jgi:RHS repeat-associated protein
MKNLLAVLTLVFAVSLAGVQRLSAQITLDGSNHCTSYGHQVTSVSCTLPNVTAGDLITVEFGDRNGYQTSISDNKNGAHTRIYYVPDSTDPNYSGMAYFANSASGSVTVQVALSATEPWAVISAQAWKGAATSAVLDTGTITQHLTTTSLVANANCGAANAPGAAGELILSYMVPDWDFSVTAGANYTLIDLPNSPDNPAFPEYWIQTTAQATNGPFTSAADDWTVGCAAFKPKTSLPTPTLTVSGLPNPSTFNQAVTFTATISSGPTGTITFYDGGTSIGPGSINGTVATITTNALAVGSHSITASWPGNPSYNPVTSSPVTQTVSPITPTLTLSSSLNPSPQGAGVTFTATISNGLTGTVTFYNGGSSIGPGSISGATATITTSTLPAGNDLITASWPGNGTFGPVTSSPLTQTVNQPVSGQTIYSYAATYDVVGNVISYTDSVMGTMNFTYDTLNRLATANGNEPHNPYPNYCWNLDSFGNRLTQMSASVAFPSTMGGPTTCQTTGSLGPVVQAQFSGTVNGVNNNQMSWTSTNSNQGQGYDAAGNVKNDGARQYLYDGEGRICEVLNTLVGVTTAYIYDAEGRRVAKGSANWGSCDPSANGFQASTDYVLGPSGEQVTEVSLNNGVATGVAHANAWAGGMLLATYDVNGLHFYLTDPLGSRRVQTDYAGVLEKTCQSLPYGDGESCVPTPTEHLFTGKERDSESGNDYFGARYYSSAMGRFMSPDWSAKVEPVPYSKLDDPQTLNLYAYLMNNPLAGVDADGHQGPDRGNTNCASNNSSAGSGCEGQTTADQMRQENQAAAQQTYGRQSDGSYKADPAKVQAAIDAKKPILEPGNPNHKSECVFACKFLAQMRNIGTPQWRKGRPALGLNDTSDIGLAIATLGSGTYPSQNGNSGIYMGHDANGGIKIVDQWPNNGPNYDHPFEHTLTRHDQGAAMDPNAYFVIRVPNP